MGLKYTRTRGGNKDLYGQEYFRAASGLKNHIEKHMDKAGEDGKREAQEIVATSGTNRSWDPPFTDRKENGGGKRSGSGSGRVNTEKMYDALDYRIIRGKDVGLDVGWIKIWEAYFGAQDQGFDHGGYRTNQRVEGMGVMSHLHTYMGDRVDKALDDAIEEILRGL